MAPAFSRPASSSRAASSSPRAVPCSDSACAGALWARAPAVWGSPGFGGPSVRAAPCGCPAPEPVGAAAGCGTGWPGFPPSLPWPCAPAGWGTGWPGFAPPCACAAAGWGTGWPAFAPPWACAPAGWGTGWPGFAPAGCGTAGGPGWAPPCACAPAGCAAGGCAFPGTACWLSCSAARSGARPAHSRRRFTSRACEK